MFSYAQRAGESGLQSNGTGITDERNGESGGLRHLSGREGDLIRVVHHPPCDGRFDACVALLVVDDPGDQRGIDAQFLRDGLHTAVAEAVLSVMAGEEYLATMSSHFLTDGVGSCAETINV